MAYVTSSTIAAVIGATLLHNAEGCFRRSPTRVSVPDNKGSESVILNTLTGANTMTTPASSHRLTCTQAEVDSTKCLNGKCMAFMSTSTHREAFCSCYPDFTGARCEEFFIDPEELPWYQGNIQKASITIGVTSVFILLLLISLVAIYVFMKYKREQRKEEGEQGNKLKRAPDSEDLPAPGDDRRNGSAGHHNHTAQMLDSSPPDEVHEGDTIALINPFPALLASPTMGQGAYKGAYNRESVMYFIDDDEVDSQH